MIFVLYVHSNPYHQLYPHLYLYKLKNYSLLPLKKPMLLSSKMDPNDLVWHSTLDQKILHP
eukprot:UN12878